MLRESFDFEAAIAETKEVGYCFASDALTNEIRQALEAEANASPMEFANHINHPLNAGKPNQVQQQHERAYFE